ncbi:preprotein translocase subunit YajC [Xylella fastidiosa subsp. fastidiosa]|jgi:preprotein translocase subunit YajC|uniref:Sec translocon accessory complex subunit YajC n=3 Tax=Xylella fastidiosa TaxID=2371 RepID=B2I6T0_XYLF2|nr:preprotein translocase, YajC subunit [Xylella fastidiosa M23]AIC09342.1 preprotein translocase subunit YajC [Xylella fastidiosa subsp. sandyi Ann-1]KAF0571750.1 preprotein translocase subunit YajC [Xylella fastidiosa subsp. fastidiosa Mus-1]NBI37910.1 preprotein translocase subunit YajC [Xylella fastidiosa subsp. fastidiosa]QIS24960.1 preprotein translocase subunit YajC [Xylella fastidiosa]RWA44833.1 preprotein translocase subunit YajC [Xylella fastidiosa subsp. sandyi]
MEITMNLFDFFIPVAQAQSAAPAGASPGGGLQMFFLPVILIAVMYFSIIRPQMKRQKEYKTMMDHLGCGDEVITAGGIAGVVSVIGDEFVTVEIAENVRVRVQKSAIAKALPKGSLPSAK